jgi:hypothetical protein
MPQTKVPIQKPGSFGLNTEETYNSELGFQWCQVAHNVVINRNGNLAKRGSIRSWAEAAGITNEPTAAGLTGNVFVGKDSEAAGLTSDFANVWYIGTGTAVAFGNDPSIWVTHVEAGIGALGNDIFDVSSTFTDAASGFNWQFCDAYSDIEAQNYVIGAQFETGPVYWDYSATYSAGVVTGTTTNFEPMVKLHAEWINGTTYAVGSTVRATGNDHQDYYMYCSTSGTSETLLSNEPTWDPVDGGTIDDNTLTWTYVELPKGNCCHWAFGRLWMMDSTSTVLHFSAILEPSKWYGTGAGSVDLKKTEGFLGGLDRVVAIASVQNNIVIFGKDNILIYNNDPIQFALQDSLPNVGLDHRDSVQNIGADLLFMDDTGLRSLLRSVSSESGRLEVLLLSKHNKLTLLDNIADAEDDGYVVRSAYDQIEGNYMLFMGDITWCFDLKFPLEDGSLRTTTWGIDDYAAGTTAERMHGGHWDSVNSKLIIGFGSDGFNHGGFARYLSTTTDSDGEDADDTNVYWLTNFSNLGDPRKKFIKSIEMVTRNSANGQHNVIYGYDALTEYPLQTSATTQGVFADTLQRFKFITVGNGEYIQVGSTMTTNRNVGEWVSISFNLTMGRLE